MAIRGLLTFLLAIVVVVIGQGRAVLAGEQYVDATGYAASGFDVVAFFDLEQAPPGQTQPPAVQGRLDLVVDYNGAKWAFSSEENRTRFENNPLRFAPRYDGHSAYGVAYGGKVPGNPNIWRIIEGRLYFNITKTVEDLWEADISGHLVRSDANWPDLEPRPAATFEIPQFDGPTGPIDPATLIVECPDVPADADAHEQNDASEANETPSTSEEVQDEISSTDIPNDDQGGVGCVDVDAEEAQSEEGDTTVTTSE